MKTNIPYKPSGWTATQWFIFIVVMILLLLLGIVTTGKAQAIDRTVIDKEAKAYVNDLYNQGLVIGVITPHEQMVLTYGETKKGNGIRPDTNAIFEIGGISELFTASLLAVMEKEGKLSSLETVKEVLRNKVDIPNYVRKICIKSEPQEPTSVEDMGRRPQICYPDPNSMPQEMILCDLASHSSGLPEEPSLSIFKNTKNPYADFTTAKLNKYVSNLQAVAPFGYEYNHSTLGMALLGEAMEVRSGKTYGMLLKEKILDPLGMSHTFTGMPNGTQKRLYLYGHTNNGVGMPHQDFNALTPAVGVRSSVPDLMVFLKANMMVPSTPLSYGLLETQHPRLYTNPFNMNYMVGWGWIIMPLNERDKKNTQKVWWQCGERGGFSSFTGFIKDNNIGVIILSNSAESVDDLALKILRDVNTQWEKGKSAQAGNE
jgi:CubicO group peptidase (beta-lactamase class C family)